MDGKKYAMAVGYFQKSYNLSAAVYGPAHLRTAFAMGSLALAHARTGKLEKARLMMDEVVALERASPDIAPAEMAWTLTNIAELSLQMREPKQAAAYYREAVLMWRRVSQSHPEETAAALQGYARALKAGHNPEARRVEKEAKTFLQTRSH